MKTPHRRLAPGWPQRRERMDYIMTQWYKEFKIMQKNCEQLQSELDEVKKDRDVHSKVRQKHLVRHGKACAEVAQLHAELAGRPDQADYDAQVFNVGLLEAELRKYMWIPVEEGLPKNGGSRLLAYGKDGYGYKIVVATSYDEEFKIFRILQDVTHWKYITLPEKEVE